MTQVEKLQQFKGVDLFCRVPEASLGKLAAMAELERHRPDATLLRQGHRPDGFYIIVTGRVVLSRGQLEIGQLEPGDAIGSSLLWNAGPQPATATTVEPSTLLRVDGEALAVFLIQDYELQQAITRSMAQRLRALLRSSVHGQAAVEV